MACVIDPEHLSAGLTGPGVYSTLDSLTHPLSKSTILDNGGAVHLVNTRDLLVPGSFKPADGVECIERPAHNPSHSLEGVHGS